MKFQETLIMKNNNNTEDWIDENYAHKYPREMKSLPFLYTTK
jgi:hypothetical protein